MFQLSSSFSLLVIFLTLRMSASAYGFHCINDCTRNTSTFHFCGYDPEERPTTYRNLCEFSNKYCNVTDEITGFHGICGPRCHNRPCLNNGTCFFDDGIAGYLCICAQNYFGPSCMLNMSSDYIQLKPRHGNKVSDLVILDSRTKIAEKLKEKCTVETCIYQDLDGYASEFIDEDPWKDLTYKEIHIDPVTYRMVVLQQVDVSYIWYTATEKLKSSFADDIGSYGNLVVDTISAPTTSSPSVTTVAVTRGVRNATNPEQRTCKPDHWGPNCDYNKLRESVLLRVALSNHQTHITFTMLERLKEQFALRLQGSCTTSKCSFHKEGTFVGTLTPWKFISTDDVYIDLLTYQLSVLQLRTDYELYVYTAEGLRTVFTDLRYVTPWLTAWLVNPLPLPTPDPTPPKKTQTPTKPKNDNHEKPVSKTQLSIIVIGVLIVSLFLSYIFWKNRRRRRRHSTHNRTSQNNATVITNSWDSVLFSNNTDIAIISYSRDLERVYKLPSYSFTDPNKVNSPPPTYDEVVHNFEEIDSQGIRIELGQENSSQQYMVMLQNSRNQLGEQNIPQLGEQNIPQEANTEQNDSREVIPETSVVQEVSITQNDQQQIQSNDEERNGTQDVSLDESEDTIVNNHAT